MFGANEIVGRKSFMNAEAGSLLVTSIFYTLQGEGLYAGRPAVFVRLAKCNLACSFCDTFFDAGDRMSYEEILMRIGLILEAVGKGRAADRIGLVITGGEPFLQPQLTDFLHMVMLNAPKPLFAWTQIESNGTMWMPINEAVKLIISPKCAEIEGVARRYIQPSQRMLERADALKFVIRAPNGSAQTELDLPSDPYTFVPSWAHDWNAITGKPIFISPMNIYNDIPAQAKAMRWIGKEANAIPDLHMRSTVDEVVSFWEPGLLNMKANEANHKWAGNYCLLHGYTLSLQMHLYAGLA